MTKLEQLRDILPSHYGKRNPITAEKIGINEDDTHSQTRALILECAQKFKLPLAASNQGYYLISNQ